MKIKNGKSKIFSSNTIFNFGCNFGRHRRVWNPRMKKYIYKLNKNKFYILNIELIESNLIKVYNFLSSLVKDPEKKILFVGTANDSVAEIVKNEAIRSESFYIINRWLGGTLTNYNIIKKRIKYMQKIEKDEKIGKFKFLPKKEVLLLRKKYYRLKKYLDGIQTMKKLPDCVIVANAKIDKIAIDEAKLCKIPVIAITNTDSDPTGIDYVVPGNNIILRSLNYFMTVFADAICEGRGLSEPKYAFKTVLEVPEKYLSKSHNFNNDKRNNLWKNQKGIHK